MSVPLQEDGGDGLSEAYKNSIAASAKGIVHEKRAPAATLQWTKRNVEGNENDGEDEENDTNAEDAITDGLAQSGATEQSAYLSSDAEEVSQDASTVRISPEERSGLGPQTLKEMEEIGLMWNILWRVQSGERDVPRLARVLSQRFSFDGEPIRRYSRAYINYMERMLEEEELKREADREASDGEEDGEEEGSGGPILGQTTRARRMFSSEILRGMLERQGEFVEPLDEDRGSGSSGNGDGEVGNDDEDD